MMKSRKKAGKKKIHRSGTKRKGAAKGKKMYRIGRNRRNVRVTAVQVESDMTLQERTISKIWDNEYDEAWNKHAPVSSSSPFLTVSQKDVVLVPFPFSNLSRKKYRPT